ncbi:regulatory associated protein of mTOR [Galdieria sulphuraria]|uniref:Regulatory associated protein of mTOR n=1 Tax=Galdieria sulphuraria TaxID=130081 RepID=M2W5X8_GALSU|nr:regulatory associated protein of mTOR [Galdieria sulphuraria]EME31176.1 regulatory associated protein of mTOR [Galdieria sulphuraria]|eukprot:XP_005707696.1 regulatory associated protein of mTOR [Galdieria sulphuraria]
MRKNSLILVQHYNVGYAALQGQYERWQAGSDIILLQNQLWMTYISFACNFEVMQKMKEFYFIITSISSKAPPPPPQLVSENHTHSVQLSFESWLGTSSALVFDCSNTVLIVSTFLDFAERRDKLASISDTYSDQVEESNSASDKNAWKRELKSFQESILFASCGAKETLPTGPYFGQIFSLLV